MFSIRETQPRHRAILAICKQLGGKAERIQSRLGVPDAVKLIDRRAVVTAGDLDQPLDFHQLRPLALAHRCDVVATYCDKGKAGHRFLFDIVLNRDGKVTIYEEYRLCVTRGGARFFVPEAGDGAVLTALTRRLSAQKRSPFQSKAGRLIAVTNGQAELHKTIYPHARSVGADDPCARY
ncbi:hypothetical protein [Stakelama saccharophila]|uniref:Uncharacterized protein n=1 Tax=Stakelama saccharophila TaxID=3075605 RepID=A0ABZ0BA23_9SPHN|nr:hypothetical protein [Stakelama sp. W311]WNO53169.1 hypothetical protein RPR59_12040 [Stakelama sp. W311]